MDSKRRSPASLGRSAVAAAVLALASPAAATVTGVCPDGSVFVVPREELIPCKQHKAVEPEQVPPLRPEYLPRPYTWQVYQEDQNPNNAYNLVDSANQVRALRDGGKLPPVAAGPDGDASADAGAGETEVAGAPPRPLHRDQGPLDLGLSDGELRDLFLIVELSQENAAASFVKESARGDERVRVALAHSPAFEARLADAWRARGATLGRVLLFSAIARDADDFYASFTFSQGALAFQPAVDDPRQFGVLQGRLGRLEAQSAVLGYVVLPPQVELSAPLEVYWDDRHATVTFAD
jgi:hypothetical protein